MISHAYTHTRQSPHTVILSLSRDTAHRGVPSTRPVYSFGYSNSVCVGVLGGSGLCG